MQIDFNMLWKDDQIFGYYFVHEITLIIVLSKFDNIKLKNDKTILDILSLHQIVAIFYHFCNWNNIYIFATKL